MLRLQESVSFEGMSFWNRPSHIVFSPNANRRDPRWYWRYSRFENPVEITPAIADCSKRRVRLSCGAHVLEVFEHMGALRHLLGGITIEGNGWTPYHGSSAHYLDVLLAHCQEADTVLPWYTIREPIRWSYSSNRGGCCPAHTQLRPNYQRQLAISVTCNYRGLGSTTEHFRFSSPESFKQVFGVPTQGWPRRNFYLSRAATNILGWPHHDEIVWPQEHSAKETLRLFVRHRVLDILGTLSLLCADGQLALDVVSYCSGHLADLKAVKASVNQLELLPSRPLESAC